MRKVLLLLLILGAAVCSAQEALIKSPNGLIEVNVGTEGGKAYYTVTRNGVTVLERSQLGLVTNYGDFTDGLTLEKWNTGNQPLDYEMTRTKASEVNMDANVLLASFVNAKKQPMVVEFKVSNRDVAFHYLLLPYDNEGRPRSAVILSEASSFSFPDGTTTFLSPQSKPMVGWERTKPSYEEEYRADRPMTERSAYGEGFVFPALFKVHTPPGQLTHCLHNNPDVIINMSTTWVLISETGVNGSYVGSHLSDIAPSPFGEGGGRGSYSIAFPQAGENNGNGTTTAGVPIPCTTPWRTITIGTLADMVETTVSYDLVEPLYEPSQEYKPGRYTWSWLIWQDESINYADQVQFIDLAAEMGFEYCLVDNWWDQRIGRDKIEELSRYAQSKGVSLMLWYNSNGYENDAPQTPRQCMSTPLARDKEMAWLKSIGVKGIKVDFFGGDKQPTMQLYEDILYDANRYGLQVIFHGCTLPRGWERMYPNFVASEAVLASENVFFNEGAAIRQPFDLTLHPFCRNATATMDWGGIILNRYMSRDNASRHTRKTTDIFELASGIIMQTSIQCVAIQPNNLPSSLGGETEMGLPQFELDFLRQLPTTWDETRFIDGYPGKYVVLARRHGNDWYIAGLNAESAAKKLTLQLPMLAGQTVSYYTDDRQGNPRLTTLKVDKRGTAKVEIQPNGGIILK